MGLARFLAAACLAVGGTASAALPAAADEQPQRYNCPTGFIWIRMSGTGCVQEELPTNGRIGYDGHAICDDGLVAIYETRPTTDGKGVPGNPATSFAYLLECLTPAQYEARQSQVEGSATLGDAASALASRGAQLPPGQLVLLGALGSGALVFAALPAVRRNGPRPPSAPPAGPETSTGPEPPEPEQEQGGDEQPLDADELRRRITALEQIDSDLARRMDEYRQAAEAGRLTPQDVVTWTGIIADLAGLIPGAQLPAGMVSVAASLAGIASDKYWDTRAVDRAIREGLGAMAQLRGLVEVQLQGYRTALAEAEAPRPPEVPPVAPELLPDETLRAERDRAHQRTLEASQRRLDAADAIIDKSEQLREQQRRITYLTDHLPDLDDPSLREAGATSNLWVDLAAGVDGILRHHQVEASTEAAKRSRDLVMRIFAGEPRGLFGVELDNAIRHSADAQFAKRAGPWTGGISAVSAGAAAYQWFHSRSVEEQRVIVERAIEGMRYDAGRLQGEIDQAEAAMRRAEAESNAEAARRRALSQEIDMRAARRGHLLWPE